jgi:hypothetical protein
MNSPVHVDCLRKMNLNRDLWFSKYPDIQTDESDTLTQQVVTNPQLSVSTQCQAVSNDQRDTNAAQQSQTQDSTDKTDDSNDNKLPQG